MISSIGYTGFGATSVVSYGNGRRLTLGYDVNRHQMTSMIVANQNGAERIVDRAYSYSAGSPSTDNDGRIKQITDNLDPNYTTTYTYDAYNRLETASAGAGGSTYYRRYSYDEWGNLNRVWTSYDQPNATIHAQQANGSGVPATNRISSVTTQMYGWNTQTVNYTWDAAGNLTNDGLRTYTYDAAGRQKEAGAVGQNTSGYDGDGMRVKKIENWGTPIYYVRSSVLKQAAMEVINGTLSRAYVYAGKTLVAMQGSDGGFYWVHKDHLGNAHKLTSASGAVVYRGEFEPYGQMVLETGSLALNNHKYSGYERDQATGLDYVQARMYSGGQGRFAQPDPAGFASARPGQPESLNRYSYTGNEPINRIDRTGRDWSDLLSLATHGACHTEEVGPVEEGIVHPVWSVTFCSAGSVSPYIDREAEVEKSAEERRKKKCPPSIKELLADPDVSSALTNAWTNSLPGTLLDHEEGGWVYWNPKTHEVNITSAPPGPPIGDGFNGGSINLNRAPGKDGWIVVGDFHTHPRTGADPNNPFLFWRVGASVSDESAAEVHNTPGIIVQFDPIKGRVDYIPYGPDIVGGLDTDKRLNGNSTYNRDLLHGYEGLNADFRKCVP